MCSQEVRSSLEKVKDISELKIRMQPAIVHFRFDPTKETLQDLIRAVRAAGSKFDARLMLQSQADDDTLSSALRSVKGVRSGGMQDKRGIRLLTFFMDQSTYYGDLQKAASAVNATISDPNLEKEKPGS